ncbi:hypothetical protein MKEN_00227600 [Mycena kentingensis (nom. inval.)]|nr:hypothetical protein MKEN_00227600 [Mycena kentingensis (nom. inval.)]
MSQSVNPFAVPRAAGPRYTPSRRNERGQGSKKRGYRRNGEMWLTLRYSWAEYSRGYFFNENMTIAEFTKAVRGYLSIEEGFQYFQPDWTVDFQSRRQSLDAEDNETCLGEIFDGGETVTAKAFNENDEQLDYVYPQGWVYH